MGRASGKLYHKRPEAPFKKTIPPDEDLTLYNNQRDADAWQVYRYGPADLEKIITKGISDNRKIDPGRSLHNYPRQAASSSYQHHANYARASSKHHSATMKDWSGPTNHHSTRMKDVIGSKNPGVVYNVNQNVLVLWEPQYPQYPQNHQYILDSQDPRYLQPRRLGQLYVHQGMGIRATRRNVPDTAVTRLDDTGIITARAVTVSHRTMDLFLPVINLFLHIFFLFSLLYLLMRSVLLLFSLILAHLIIITGGIIAIRAATSTDLRWTRRRAGQKGGFWILGLAFDGSPLRER
ncbi:hypothetical protein V8F20_010528 [Naviculisporaceae sp. PSN 640]